MPHILLKTMALCAKNYGSFWLKVPQTLIAGTSFSRSENVILWQWERHSVFLNISRQFINGFSHATRGWNLVVSAFFRTFAFGEVTLFRKWKEQHVFLLHFARLSYLREWIRGRWIKIVKYLFVSQESTNFVDGFKRWTKRFHLDNYY